MITNFFIPELNNHDVQELWFQQDGATCHTARATIDLLKETFGDRLISRFGPVNWPPRSCDLTPLDYFLWGYVKSLVYADKPQKLDHLEDNIRRVIADIRPQMLEKVIENWTSRLDYIRASCGSPMPEIIFKMQFDPESVCLTAVFDSSNSVCRRNVVSNVTKHLYAAVSRTASMQTLRPVLDTVALFMRILVMLQSSPLDSRSLLGVPGGCNRDTRRLPEAPHTCSVRFQSEENTGHSIRVISSLSSRCEHQQSVHCHPSNEVWSNSTSEQTHLRKDCLLVTEISDYRTSVENVEFSPPVQPNAFPDNSRTIVTVSFLDVPGMKPCLDFSPNQLSLRIARGIVTTLIRKEDATL
ncbi:uncharacterized protein TNCV_3215001 [Trichonephila clavipes]|nr:uncharacterized protein TNCV_3215001 [Trichonephila clavipes]